MNSRPTVIVLAAGRGSRFGGPVHKLAQPLDGRSVLSHTLRNAIASHLPVLVVTTRALADEARHLVATRDLVLMPEPQGRAEGMGTSIATGVCARPQSPGWLMLPADMPLVTPQTLQAVAYALKQHPVVYAQHAGRRGHPVGIAGELYSELALLRGEEGAKRLLARYPAFGVEVPDPGTLIDIDTAADLDVVRQWHAQRVAAATA